MQHHDPRDFMDADELHGPSAPGFICGVCQEQMTAADRSDPEDWSDPICDWMQRAERQDSATCERCAEMLDRCAECQTIQPCTERDVDGEWLCDDCATPERIDPLGARVDAAYARSL